MKSLISVFLSLLSISVSANSVIKSPQEQCVDAHMRVWELTPWKEVGNNKKKYMEKSKNYKKYKFLYQKEYYEFYDRKLLNTKNKLRAEYEADSWVRCMKK